VTSNPINKPSSEDTRCKKTSLSGRTAIGLVKRFRWIKTDTGFSMKCNFGPIDECQGIVNSNIPYVLAASNLLKLFDFDQSISDSIGCR